MKVDEFDFDLPEDRIALRPLQAREDAKLLVANEHEHQDRTVNELPGLLRPDDFLVFNNTKVIHARLHGQRIARTHQTHSQAVNVELTLHKPTVDGTWLAFIRPARRVRDQDELLLGGQTLRAKVVATMEHGEVELAFACSKEELLDALQSEGEVPLPPYISARRGPDAQDERDYQTIFAKAPGAIAAPTAGLHFTPALMEGIAKRGLEWCEVTLHVGAGTFLPVKTEVVENHKMHKEYAEITAPSAQAINAAKSAGRRIVAVGTTALRVLESAAIDSGRVSEYAAETDLFITPGYQFRIVDALFTNFHLPKSTLLMLVSAFLGTERMLDLYRHAIASNYRFYSYGDACFFSRTAPPNQISGN